MNLKQNQKGFTIVELLIVIVVIAILAAISIVAYTGIQNRAKTSTGQSLASQVEKKAQAFYTVKSTYPFDQAAFTDTDVPEAALEGNVGAFVDDEAITESQAGDGSTIAYISCNGANVAADQDAVTGIIITYFDFTAGADVHRVLGTASCSQT